MMIYLAELKKKFSTLVLTSAIFLLLKQRNVAILVFQEYQREIESFSKKSRDKKDWMNVPIL